jgi:hypothetical protein
MAPRGSDASSTARSGSTTTIRVGGAMGRTTAGAATRCARSSAGGGGDGGGIDGGRETVVGTRPVRGTTKLADVAGGLVDVGFAAGAVVDADVPTARPCGAGCRSMVSRYGW